MDLIANKRFKYRGRALRPGDPFTATRQHGKVLTAVGRASVAEHGTFNTRPVQLETKARDPMDRDGDGHMGGSLAANPPSLSGKSKSKLLEIAKAEGVAIPDPEASNKVITGLIQAKRQGGK